MDQCGGDGYGFVEGGDGGCFVQYVVYVLMGDVGFFEQVFVWQEVLMGVEGVGWQLGVQGNFVLVFCLGCCDQSQQYGFVDVMVVLVGQYGYVFDVVVWGQLVGVDWLVFVVVGQYMYVEWVQCIDFQCGGNFLFVDEYVLVYLVQCGMLCWVGDFFDLEGGVGYVQWCGVLFVGLVLFLLLLLLKLMIILMLLLWMVILWILVWMFLILIILMVLLVLRMVYLVMVLFWFLLLYVFLFLLLKVFGLSSW